MDNKRFEEMTPAERSEIVEALVKGEDEMAVEASESGKRNWFYVNTNPVGIISLIPSYYYRIAKTPDSIDWSHVHPDFICMARNKDESVAVFTFTPRRDMVYWTHTTGAACRVGAFASYKRGTVDWEDSLVYRPGHEPGEG
jgi:hypothetical protein